MNNYIENIDLDKAKYHQNQSVDPFRKRISSINEIDSDYEFQLLKQKLIELDYQTRSETLTLKKSFYILEFFFKIKYCCNIKHYIKIFSLSEQTADYLVDLKVLSDAILNFNSQDLIIIHYKCFFDFLDEYLELNLMFKILNDLNKYYNKEHSTYSQYSLYKIIRAAKRGREEDIIILWSLLLFFGEFCQNKNITYKQLLSYIAGGKIDKIFLIDIFDLTYIRENASNYQKLKLIFPILKIVSPEIKLKLKEGESEKIVLDQYYNKIDGILS
jgi:hypothetical protein